MHRNLLKTSAIILLLCGCFAVLGCQPTPESEKVASKSDGITEQQIMDKNNGFNYIEAFSNIPIAWEESLLLRNDTVTIKIDATINYPKVKGVPIIEVSPIPIRMDIVDRLLTYIVENGYILVNEKDKTAKSQYSQEEVEGWIRQVNEQLANVDNYCKDNPSLNKEEMISDLEAELERLMEMLRDAKPSIATKITDYSTLSLTSRVEGNLYNDENIPVASILIKACGGIDDDKRESQVLIRSNKDAKIISDHPINTLEDAIDICNRIMEQVGLSQEYVLVSSRNREDEIAFGLYYGRIYEGIEYSPLVSRAMNFNEQYQISWPDECIEFRIGKGKQYITQLSWRGTSSIIQTLNDNAELCSFGSIQKACCNGLSSIFAWREDAIANTSVVIDRMTLGYTRVPIKNEKDRYMLIPTWTLTGVVTNEFNEESGSGVYREMEIIDNDVVLVLNAMDGSIIYGGSQAQN